MSLNLDLRQRAMLHEMGVHVWGPLPADESLDAIDMEAHSQGELKAAGQIDLKITVLARAASDSQEVVDAPRVAPVTAPAPSLPPIPARATPPRAPAPSTVTVLPPGIEGMDWAQLQAALAPCQACAMCLGRRNSVLSAPSTPVPCDWLVVGDPPDELEERAGQPFVDAAGKLLDNMLRAVGVRRLQPEALPETRTEAAAKQAYLTPVLKCRPALVRAPTADELGTCAHYLRREIALTQPKVILAMGRFAMQVLLSETPPELAKQPLGKLRGQVWRFAGVPVVVTYPPAYLLRSGQDKGKAWADLCLAMDVAQAGLPV